MHCLAVGKVLLLYEVLEQARLDRLDAVSVRQLGLGELAQLLSQDCLGLRLRGRRRLLAVALAIQADVGDAPRAQAALLPGPGVLIDLCHDRPSQYRPTVKE